MKKSILASFLAIVLAMTPMLVACNEEKENDPVSTVQTTVTPKNTISSTIATSQTTAPQTEQKVSLKGKRIIWLGSSVTYGSATGGTSMVEYLKRSTKCKNYKYAVSGTTLVDNDSGSYVSRMKAITSPEECDYFICQLSTNDASQKKPLGTVSSSFNMEDFDTQTICGAIEYIIAYAKDRWNCPVAFYTGPRYSSSEYQAMVDALLLIQEKWGIYVLDFWNDPDFLAMSRREQNEWLSTYMADDIHPNAKGYSEWWTPKFEEFISSTIGK